MTSPFCDTAWRRNVFLYPTEYLTNGIGWNGVHEDLTPIITKPDGSKEYRISDHLASLRASLTPGVSTKYYDYDPWGGLLSGTGTRRMYNDREEDKESSLYNNGVRKLEEGLGRFTAIDPLWEKFLWQSPYVYGDNDPLRKTDPKGMQAAVAAGTVIATNPETWPVAAGVGVVVLLGADVAVKEKYPALRGMPVGGAIGVYVASQIFDGDEGGSGGSGSSGKGGSASPGGGGGSFIGGGLAAAAIKKGIDNISKKVISIVKQDAKLAKFAEQTFSGNKSLSNEANGLINQLTKGNMNPGIGTKSIGKNIFEARSKGGARVYFRNTQGGVEILGYSNKTNQQQVINRLIEIYK
ncbi:MAG: hypothetical protein IPM61_01185 [Chlorobi bacterium]|nr:hypothetical protein [Chlorobiota bacterium]